MIGLGIVAGLRALAIEARITVLVRYQFQAMRALSLGADLTVGPGEGDTYTALATVLGTRVLGRRRSNRLLQEGFTVVYDSIGSAATLHHACAGVVRAALSSLRAPTSAQARSIRHPSGTARSRWSALWGTTQTTGTATGARPSGA
jgi:hypothetical protein